MKWLDSRLHKPSSGFFDKYTVVALLFDGHFTVGRSTWIPIDNYTAGEWGEFEFTNGNKQGKLPVLFWQEHPSKPKILGNNPTPTENVREQLEEEK